LDIQRRSGGEAPGQGPERWINKKSTISCQIRSCLLLFFRTIEQPWLALLIGDAGLGLRG
jgi:hypothetical protein